MHSLRPAARRGSRVLNAASRMNRPFITARSFHRSASLSSDAFKHCLECNQKWAADTSKNDADLIPSLAKGQSPEILWLGCSDSRIPETTVLGLKPGDVFTHRNIANIINPTDVSLLSVVEFSVKHLKVKHVVVCGHTSCGGVNGALGNSSLGILDTWLQPMRALREKHSAELSKLETKEKTTQLAKLNVLQGVDVLKRIPTVIDAMNERGLEVHGVIYNLESGLLEELDSAEDGEVGKKRVDAFHTK